MSKADKETVAVEKAAPVVAEPVTGCVICGQYTGAFVAVVGAVRAHETCAAARPDVIAKVKARA